MDDSRGSGSWSGRRVLVTGATGMVGAWLVRELLRRDAFVVALVRDVDPQSDFYRSGIYLRATVVSGSIEDFSTLERAITLHEVDTVFHLAAQTLVGVAQRSPLATFDTNIRGTYNLLEACRQQRQVVERVVVASSDKAYGTVETLPYTEEMPLLGRYPYEVSKSCADLLAASYHHSYDLPVAIARCGNIYGGGDLNWSRIVPGTIRSLLRSERPVLRSDGTYLRDYIYVKDVCGAYLALAEGLPGDGVTGEAFNFSDESPLSVLQIVAAVARSMEREDLEPRILDNARGEIRNQYLSAAKARERLGWSAEYTLERGLEETIAWYREFFGS